MRYIALLRAINVGGHTVRMERLRALFEALGFSRVATFIASGNVIFDSPATSARTLERRIERHLHESLGFEVATFLRTPAELAAVAAFDPFPDAAADGSVHGVYVAFVAEPPTVAARRKVLALRSPTDDLHVRGREVYWLSRTSMRQSTMSGAVLERELGMPATLRNTTSVRKLSAAYPPG